MRGIGKNRARNGKPLTLAAGELDAALADDRVIALREALGELVDAGDATGGKKLLLGRIGPGEHDVVADRSIEEERVLQHHAQLAAIAVEPHGGEIHCRRCSTVPEVGVWKAQTRLMMVDLPEPEEPTSAVTVPGFDVKEMPCSTGLSSS